MLALDDDDDDDVKVVAAADGTAATGFVDRDVCGCSCCLLFSITLCITSFFSVLHKYCRLLPDRKPT